MSDSGPVDAPADSDDCSTCKFVMPDNTCHAHPPIALTGLMGQTGPTWVWPTVANDDWCGEFQPVTPAPATNLPINKVPPLVTGSLASPSIMQCSQGQWDNNPYSFTYQWSSGGAEVPNATSNYYQTSTTDVGLMLSCVVSASNEFGVTVVTSNHVGPIS